MHVCTKFINFVGDINILIVKNLFVGEFSRFTVTLTLLNERLSLLYEMAR